MIVTVETSKTSIDADSFDFLKPQCDCDFLERGFAPHGSPFENCSHKVPIEALMSWLFVGWISNSSE